MIGVALTLIGFACVVAGLYHTLITFIFPVPPRRKSPKED